MLYWSKLDFLPHSDEIPSYLFDFPNKVWDNDIKIFFVIKIMFNINCHEFTTAFRGYNLKKLEGFDLRNVKSKGYSFFMETIFLINKKNIPIKEIPFHAQLRYKGKSKIERIEIFRTLINVLRLKFNF